jgi:hypothetical protein
MAEAKAKEKTKKAAAKKVEVVEQKKDTPKPKIKASDLPTLEAVRWEIGKKSCKHFIEYFVKIEDRDAVELAVPFTLWPGQVQALDTFLNNRLNIVLKARQLGLTWLSLIHISEPTRPY